MGMKFLNPYHFLPFQEEKSIWEEDNSGESYTGVLSYEVTTKTPLLIPGQILKRDREENDREGEETGHPYKRFFTYDNIGGDLSLQAKYRPAIPGSEIRGAIRSIYETLTNSCLSMIDEEEAITRRISDIFSPGLIRRTVNGNEIKYILLPAGKAQIDYQTIDKLKLKDGAVCKGKITGRYFRILDNGETTGYLLKGEKPRRGGRKSHYTMMYLIKTNDMNIELSETDIKNLQRILSIYDDDRLNKQIAKDTHWYAGYKEELDRFLSGTLTNASGAETLFPVYYSKVEDNDKENSMLYLSPACITKEIYNTTIKSIITGYHPCQSKNGSCPACHLFGMAGDTNEDSAAGKLRFTDLDIADGTNPEDYYYYDKKYCDSNGMVTLQELSMPKPSAAEFYLQMPQDTKGELLNWNYDYYVYNGKKGPEFMLCQNGYQPKIMGRKFYWHNLCPQFSADTGETKELKTKRNQTVQLVDSEKTFKGKIYFNGISRTELCRIIWICNISNLWEGHGYKIGGGKPLGLGSVEMRVTDISHRTLSIHEENIQYCGRKKLKIEDLFEGTDKEQYYQKSCFSKEVMPQFWMMTKFLNGENVQSDKQFTVAYPIAFETKQDENSGTKANGYLWFSNNRIDAANGKRDTVLRRSNMRFDQHLSKLEDISKAQLNSTITSKPAATCKGEIVLEKSKPLKTRSPKTKPEKSCTFNLFAEYSVTVTGKEPYGDKYMVSFVNDQKNTGKVLLKKNEAGNIETGSKIRVRCNRIRGPEYIFILVKQNGKL